MELCEAVATADGVSLTISGGMPAYASDLTVTINANGKFTCAFWAVYPAPTSPLRWKITKKALKLRSLAFEPGSRLHGWISVEFEEIDITANETPRSFRIEGHFKPVVLDPPQDSPAGQGKPDS